MPKNGRSAEMRGKQLRKIDGGPRKAATNQKNNHHHSEKSWPQYRCWDRRRRDAEHRSQPLGCGCRDPWLHRCNPIEPTEQQVSGYRDAIAHLETLGMNAAPLLPELRHLWRRGGSDRRIAQSVVQRWEVLA